MHFTYKTTNKRENREKITLHPHTKRVNYLCYMRMESVAVCVCMFVCCINKLMCRSVNSVIFYVCLSPLFTWFRPEKKIQQQQRCSFALYSPIMGFTFFGTLNLTGHWVNNTHTHTHTFNNIEIYYENGTQTQSTISMFHLFSTPVITYNFLVFHIAISIKLPESQISLQIRTFLVK